MLVSPKESHLIGCVIDSNILGFGQDSRFDSWFISRAIRLILIGSAEMTHSPLPYFSSKPSFWAQSFTFTKLESLIPKTDFWFSINKISDNLCVSIDRTTAIASSRIYTSITLVSSAAIRNTNTVWNRDYSTKPSTRDLIEILDGSKSIQK